MPKVKGLKLTESEVSQTIDLNKLFGTSFAGNSGLAQAIGQDIIDTIISRTEAGKGVDGKDLKSPYSSEYSDTLEFKAFGKKKDKVNMKLTGQMLGTLDVLENRDGEIVIGWADATENAKAFNHNTGDTVPKRQFFGVNDDDLKEIKRRHEERVAAETRTVQGQRDLIINEIIGRLNPFSAFKFGGGGGNG